MRPTENAGFVLMINQFHQHLASRARPVADERTLQFCVRQRSGLPM
jgi:hypothetical protein